MKKINIFGKQISAIILGLTLMVALASAAVLTYFGMFTGTADVSQSVLVDGEDISAMPIEGAWNGSIIAGATTIEKHDLSNNAEVPVTVDFNTTCEDSTWWDSLSPSTDEYIDWATHCDGITTRYVEYFDDAGADLSSYEAPADCDAIVNDSGEADYDTIQTAINNEDSGNTICVVAGTYNEQLTIDNSITLASLEGPQNTIITAASTGENAIEISSNDVIIKGFNITGGIQGINVVGQDGIVIRDNAISGYDGQSAEGIWVDNSKVSIINNVIQASETANSDYSIDSIYTKGEATVTVDHNTLKNNRYSPDAYGNNDWSTSAGIAVHNGDEVTATYNLFDNNDFGIQVKGEDVLNEVTANHNNFKNSNSVDFFCEKTGSITSGTSFDATENWWGTNGIDIAAGDSTGLIDVDGYITADWMTKTDMILAPGETDHFGIINEFNIALIPDSYTIRTKVIPATQ